MRRKGATAAAILLWTVAGSVHALAADIKVLTPGAMNSSLKQIIPPFEGASGHKITVTLSPALAIPEQIKKGEAADVVIPGAPAVEALEKLGKVVAGSKVVIARVGVGVFVRRGDPKPDVSTVEAFERALLSAKVITYSDPALGGSASNYVAKLIESLDTTGAIKPKIKMAAQYRSIANFVAAGGVDLRGMG